MIKFILEIIAPSQDVLENINWEKEIQYDNAMGKVVEHYHPDFSYLTTIIWVILLCPLENRVSFFIFRGK